MTDAVAELFLAKPRDFSTSLRYARKDTLYTRCHVELVETSPCPSELTHSLSELSYAFKNAKYVCA